MIGTELVKIFDFKKAPNAGEPIYDLDAFYTITNPIFTVELVKRTG